MKFLTEVLVATVSIYFVRSVSIIYSDRDSTISTFSKHQTTLTPKKLTKLYTCTGKSFKCDRPGVFANPHDTTTYFKCYKSWGRWDSVCFTCSSKYLTCFNNDIKACAPCKTEDSPTLLATYDCEGYDWKPCRKLGHGLFRYPGDPSVYLDCKKLSNGTITGTCEACPEGRNSCFDETYNQCIDQCDVFDTHLPYDCSGYTEEDVDCKRDVLVASPTDASVFFNCDFENGKWNISCFTCSKGLTCFSESQQTCVKYKGKWSNRGKCPRPSEIVVSTLTEAPDKSLTWDCSGYNELSFPCQYYGLGDFETPADKSVWFTCEQESVAKCHACPAKEYSCYNPTTHICVRDCVSREHQPYNCSSYDYLSYECKKSGYFANPNDTSIYFECVNDKINDTFRALCYTCSSSKGRKQTCYSEEHDSCVTIDAYQHSTCGPQGLRGSKETSVSKHESLTYDTNGYTSLSFPCAEKGYGNHTMHGDPSIWVFCGKTAQETQLFACPINTRSCYDASKKLCVDNCGGTIETNAKVSPTLELYSSYSYSCRNITYRCKREGVFPIPFDPSVYIKCETRGGSLLAICFTCNKELKSCFSKKFKACIISDSYCASTPDSETYSAEMLSYSCEGYSDLTSVCRLLGIGVFAIPGDKSIYLECLSYSNGRVVANCYSCDTDECFSENFRTCVACSEPSRLSFSV